MIQWFDTEEELADLYYLAIRLGIENKTEELGIRLLKESFASISETQVDGTIALGKFDAQQIAQLKRRSLICYSLILTGCRLEWIHW
ncbi:Galactose operon repressor, GalR-LacI familyoftranscriptional regulator [Enterococcus sp. HSIEG1]|nr:Galactose operon repressor, GalR-LacI familyoftranscriptional regulator [Enterococcus sp. HSIEG1]